MNKTLGERKLDREWEQIANKTHRKGIVLGWVEFMESLCKMYRLGIISPIAFKRYFDILFAYLFDWRIQGAFYHNGKTTRMIIDQFDILSSLCKKAEIDPLENENYKILLSLVEKECRYGRKLLDD